MADLIAKESLGYYYKGTLNSTECSANDMFFLSMASIGTMSTKSLSKLGLYVSDLHYLCSRN